MFPKITALSASPGMPPPSGDYGMDLGMAALRCSFVLDTIFEMYKGSPLSLQQVADATGIPIEQVTGMTNFLETLGHVEKTSEGAIFVVAGK
jgi:hypothetical protein